MYKSVSIKSIVTLLIVSVASVVHSKLQNCAPDFRHNIITYMKKLFMIYRITIQ